ncbi:hypothetical protein BH11PSE7_BH11PSE7_03240 [soil metagenome]
MLRKLIAVAATAALAKKAYDVYQDKKAADGKPSMDAGDATQQPVRRSVKAGPLSQDVTSSPQ